jgi:hypothetical protein
VPPRLVPLLLAAIGAAACANKGDDLADVRAELADLRAEQRSMRQEIRDLRALLAQEPPPAAEPPSGAPEPPSAAAAAPPAAPAAPAAAPGKPPAQGSVNVQVESNPAGATVFLAEKKVGVTPVMLRIPVGSSEISVRLEKSGYRPRLMTLRPEEDTKISVQLAKKSE